MVVSCIGSLLSRVLGYIYILTIWEVYWIVVSCFITRKQKCSRFEAIFVTDCIRSCHFENFRCRQSRKLSSFFIWQLPVLAVTKIASRWRHFRFSEYLSCKDGYYDESDLTPFPNTGPSNINIWGWDKLAAIWQTIFSNAFNCTKIVFWFKFHWHLFPMVQLTISNIGLDNGLVPDRRQAMIWTNDDPDYWRAYLCHSAPVN